MQEKFIKMFTISQLRWPPFCGKGTLEVCSNGHILLTKMAAVPLCGHHFKISGIKKDMEHCGQKLCSSGDLRLS